MSNYNYRVYTSGMDDKLKHVATITNPDEVIKYINDEVFHVMVIRHHIMYDMDDIWINEHSNILENTQAKVRKL